MQKRTARQIYSTKSGGQQDKQDLEQQQSMGIKELLHKISSQLESMQSQSSSGSIQERTTEKDQQNVGREQKKQSQTQESEPVAEQLQHLFQQLLQGTQCQNPKDSEQGFQTESQNQESKASTVKDNNQNRMTAQTAAQALAHAQYELSTELEASLTKLKQVITESEKLANKISVLLGEENNKQG